jgi:hypothetical protein
MTYYIPSKIIRKELHALEIQLLKEPYKNIDVTSVTIHCMLHRIMQHELFVKDDNAITSDIKYRGDDK